MAFWKSKNFVSNSLKFYDLAVNKINCKYVWRCSENYIFENYKKNIRRKHLEIGPGTGYFLKKINNSDIDLTLMDINQPILQFSSNNLKTSFSNVKIRNHNIFEKKIEEKYDSIGINYVLHCVPGKLEDKIDKLLNNLNKHGILFGATVISDPERLYFLSKLELKALNKFNVFNNSNDYSQNLINYLNYNQIKYDCNLIGNVLIFEINLQN